MTKSSGEATLSKIFLSPLSIGVNSYRKEFAPEEQILSFKSRPIFQRGIVYNKTNWKSQKVVSLVI